MPYELKKYVHSENIRNFSLKLADKAFVGNRDVVVKLLAEEIASFTSSVEQIV